MTGKDIKKIFDYIDETCAMADEMGACTTDACPFVNECMGDGCVLEMIKDDEFWNKFVTFRDGLDEDRDGLEFSRMAIDYDLWFGKGELAYQDYMDSMRDADADARWELEQGIF